MNAFLTVAQASLKPEGLLFLSIQPVILENRPQFERKLSRLRLENCWPNLNRYAYPDFMLQEVIFQMACWDVEPHLTRLLFGCPYLHADFMLFRRSPDDHDGIPTEAKKAGGSRILRE